jgi:hypothetical protein
MNEDKPKINHLVVNEITTDTEQPLVTYAVDLLNDQAQHITATQARRLELARGLAVNELARQQTFKHNSNVLQAVASRFSQHRAVFSLLLLALILVLFATEIYRENHNLESSDAFLLSSDLPPEAYADQSFESWLDAK